MNKSSGFMKQINEHFSYNQGNLSDELNNNYKSILINIIISGCLIGSIN